MAVAMTDVERHDALMQDIKEQQEQIRLLEAQLTDYWLHFRHETARAFMASAISGALGNPNLKDFDISKCIAESLRYADALIEELRK